MTLQQLIEEIKAGKLTVSFEIEGIIAHELSLEEWEYIPGNNRLEKAAHLLSEHGPRIDWEKDNYFFSIKTQKPITSDDIEPENYKTNLSDLNKKEITIPAGTVKKGDVVSISTIHNKAPNPLTAEESNAYKYLQDNSERGFWIKEQLKEFAIGYAVRKHEELSSQQNAELKKDNESFQKFKERCNGLDPIKVIEVAAKHSSFELILEHVMRSIEIESLRKKSAEMMRILELWEVATRGVNIPDEMNDIEFFAADKATDQFFKSLTGDKEKGVNNE